MDGRDSGDGVVTLEEAVADFDVALRDHRSRRRGLGSTSAGAAVLPASASQDEEELTRVVEQQAGGGVGSPLHNTEASNWLDGQAMSWATVDLGIERDPREWGPRGSQENEMPNEAGGSIGRDGPSTPLTAPATRPACVPHTPPTLDDASISDIVPQPADNTQQVVHDEELGCAPECSSSLKSPLSPEPAEYAAKGDDVLIASGTPTVARDPGGSRPSSPPVSTRVDPPGTNTAVAVAAVAEEAASSRELLSTEQSSLLPSSPSMAEKVMNAGVGIIAREKEVEAGADPTNDRSIGGIQVAASADRIGATAGGRETQQISCGSPPAAAAASAPGENGVVPSAAVGGIAAAVSASKTPEAAVPATSGNADTGAAAATAATVIAPQTSLAMECPDPVATVEQRTAGNWMEGIGSSSQHRLPAPLAIAEAEAELAEKVGRLQSKRLVAELEERGALEVRRTVQFGQERAVRTEGFAEEDRKALAAEERRLAELRREADLGRLQRGAEFQEADEALGVRAAPASSATTGVTPMPVRGMRPQHFAEQEDLPGAIKETLDRPAEKVLDEMEALEARAKAAGGGMNVEAFERVEQRQRARQVERMEILHGQTVEEKSATMLMMAVRLQMFARRKVARMRVARLKHARSASKGRVSISRRVSVSVS